MKLEAPSTATNSSHLDTLAGLRVGHLGTLARVVHEELLARAMLLAHQGPLPVQPGRVRLAELGVGVAGGMLVAVLAVEQLAGHPRLLELVVDPERIDRGAHDAHGRRGAVDARLQGRVVQGLDGLPVAAGVRRPPHHDRDRAHGHAKAGRHLPVATPQGPLLSKNLADLSHGQSLRGHRAPLGEAQGLLDCPASLRAAVPTDSERHPVRR